jgi:hypothetical protein
MSSLQERMQQVRQELSVLRAEPWTRIVAREVRGMDVVSSRALLDLLGVPQTTGNARRLAGVMRELGFVPLKSRRLAPGGFKDCATRGWARPLASGRRISSSQGGLS